MSRLALVATILFLNTGETQGQASYPPTLTDCAVEVYKTVGDTELKMWIYSPRRHQPQQEKRPAVVFFFGGGWRSGTPAQFESHCRYLASRGMVAATADYRVANRHGVKADACVEDAKSAVRWLRANSSRLGLDATRIAAGGGSAGGHTACCTALIKGLDAKNEAADVSSVPNLLILFNPAVMIAPLPGFEASGIAQEKFIDIATRTGVPAAEISPIHHVRPGLPPTIIFHGKADPTVPYATVDEFSRRMRDAGNDCRLSGFAEAPHGFFNVPKGNNPARRDRSDQWHRRTLVQMDRFLQSHGWLQGASTIRIVDQDFVSLRGHLQNSFAKFAAGKTGHVAFLGGSITEMNGYRPLICDWLQQRFPETDFTFTNAGIASTCSSTGAFRLQRDVLIHGDVDLLLVEFAVNDDQDAMHSASACIRGMEGIVRQTRLHNPDTDIVMTHFVNPGMLETLAAGQEILSASQHESVARHYSVSSVYLSKLLAARISDGMMTWEQFGGTHPKQPGNQLAADMVTAVLDAGWRGLESDQVTVTPHPLPEKPLLKNSFFGGTLMPHDSVQFGDAWSLSVPAWSEIPGAKRNRFTMIPLLHSQTVGAEFTTSFRGTAIGAFLLAGPDAGQIDVQIDEGEWKTVETYHRFSKGLHYPRTVMFSTELPNGQHELRLRVAQTRHAESHGNAVRIIALTQNPLQGSP